MLKSFFEARKARRIAKRGWRLSRAGDANSLTQLALDHRGTPLHPVLQALRARCIAQDDDRAGALDAFNALYISLKGSEDRDGRYLRLFALYNLALIRNSLPEAAHFARKAREVKVARRLRAFLPLPLLVLRAEPPPAITATL